MDKRLIEVDFPLEATSIDSVHEKNVRHGHISTLHIWPARRPLAASRAALIATLLPDPGNKEERKEILERLAGRVVLVTKKKKIPSGKVEEIAVKETVGGILHWGLESGPDLDWFRQEIHKAYGGRAPRVLDPFAGGGAIPLEAMRLGCDVTAVDINPVAWFILKCTLEYPQRLAGQKRRLPDFALQDRDFMRGYLKAMGLSVKSIATQLDLLSKIAGKDAQSELFKQLTLDPKLLEADLAWHVRAWGRWVLREARRELAPFYPTYAEYCSVKPYGRVPLARAAEEQLKLVPTNEEGEPQTDLQNTGFSKEYLDNPKNPRWVAKPTIAYLWARTVKCKACRAEVPLLKTRWLARKDNKRVLLTMEPNGDRTGVAFGIDSAAKVLGGNPAQRREHDKRIGVGTMSRSGAKCPCCATIMTTEDLRLEGRSGRLGAVMTAVVTDGLDGKEYRTPTKHEVEMAARAEEDRDRLYLSVPFGLPEESIPLGASRQGGGSPFTTPLYGLDRWIKLFNGRQALALGKLLLSLRKLPLALEQDSYGAELATMITALLATALNKVSDRGSTLCTWTIDRYTIRNTFARFALPISWDYVESVATADSSGGFQGGIEWTALFLEHAAAFAQYAPSPHVLCGSAIKAQSGEFDVVVTDPPYYDAIPYSDLMDFFYVWLRRALHGLSPEFDSAFAEILSPKWDHQSNDGELVDDASRFSGDKAASKRNYEVGMAKAFQACHAALKPDGRLVIVFAHKHPDAWETLVGAIIRAGFVVVGSWPIQTEMTNRTRAHSSAALASSVWLVCRKRGATARAGWDTDVLKEMQLNITQRLRDFWDAGIRGPDFVWAATGPALEAYSQYPAVKKATEPGALMSVSEFLRHVRRIVVDFVVGRVLSGGEAKNAEGDHVLDDVTNYYLLHRNDFGQKDAPAGACILYAISCGLSERVLADQHDVLIRGKVAAAEDAAEGSDDESGDEEDDSSATGGGQFRLKAWSQRLGRNLGLDTGSGRAVPLIDQVHKVMHLWKAGDEHKVNDYLEMRGLRSSAIFAKLLQALIEKSRAEGQSEECAVLEKLSNHLRKIGAVAQGALAIDG